MGIGVFPVEESRLCTLVFDESLSLFVVVSKSIGARFKHLVKVDVCNVVRINNAIGSAHDGTVVEKAAPLIRVPLVEPLP